MNAVSLTRLACSVICLAVITTTDARAQISITALSSAVTENFNTIGTTATATLPSNWRMSPQNGGAAPTWSAGISATTQAASSGSPATGGRYNWGLGTDTTDRAIGFMTSGSYASANSVMAFYQNNSGSTISDLSINYNLERYRVNTAAASVSMFYSLDGSTWTSISNSTSTFATAASAYSFSPPATTSMSISLSSLSISNGSSFYLRWNFNTTGGNSQGLGLDDVSVSAASAVPEPSTYAALAGAAALVGVMVHRRRQRLATKA